MKNQGKSPPIVGAMSGTSTKGVLNDIVALHRQFGDIVAIHYQGVPTILFGGATGPPIFFRAERDHMEVYNTPLVRELFGKAIFNMRGTEHLKAKQLLRGSLSGTSLETFAPDMVQLVQRHVHSWLGQGFELYQAARALTLSVCTEILLGFRHNDPTHELFCPAFDAFVRASESESPHSSEGFKAGNDLRSLILNTMRKIQDSRSNSVLSHLMVRTGRHNLDSIALPDHLLALMIATRETTASLVTWFLVELAENPSLAEAYGNESRTFLGTPAGLTIQNISDPLSAALLEVERLHSPNSLSRRLVTANCPLDKHVIPEGWHAAYSPAANHMLPHLFNDPQKFHVKRFSDGMGAQCATSLLTFGSGIHACPGRQFVEMLALAIAFSVCGDYRLTLPKGRPIEARFLPTKAPTKPILAALRKRFL